MSVYGNWEWGDPAAVTILATVASIGTGTGVTTPGMDTTGANALFAVLSTITATLTPTINDSLGNTWNLVRFDSQGTTPNIFGTAIFSAVPGPGQTGVGQTFTAPAMSSIGVIACGGGSGIPLDQQNGTVHTLVTVMNPGPITPSVGGTLVLYAVQDFIGPAIPTTPAGYTLLLSSAYVPTAAYCFGFFYQLQTTATTTNPTSFISATNFQESSIANFR